MNSTTGAHQPSVRRAVEILVDYGATEVIVFGSAARRDGNASSDLDLACRGVPPARFFHAYGHLIRALDRPVDLVDLDAAKETLRARIEGEGLLVHGA